MKKAGIISLILAFALLLGGCGVELATWQETQEVGNGVYVVVAQNTDKNFEWYCTADASTKAVLSVNLIYPQKYGEPKEIICTADQKKISCNLQMGEQDGKMVAFFTLPSTVNNFECEKEILITVKLGRKKVKFKFIPSTVSKVTENI